MIILDQDKIKEETISLLKKICQSDVGTNYKLGKANRFLNLNIYKLSLICFYHSVRSLISIFQGEKKGWHSKETTEVELQAQTKQL